MAGDAGDLIRVTTTSGAVTITLPTISTVEDGFKVAIVKWTGDANAVTVNRSGSDTINGATSSTIGSQYSQTTFVADFQTNQWFAASSGLGASNVAVDAFSGNGSTTAFTLSGDPGSENNTQVFVSGVYQEKDTYSVSGTTLTFSTAPPTGTSNIEVVWTAPLAIGTPSDGTVTTAKIASNAVTLTSQVTGTLPVANGGTGLTTVPHTVQVFTSGSGTYTTPANCKAIWVRAVGGGGGGGSNGASGQNSGSTGGSTTFGSLTASGGSGAFYNASGGGASGGDINSAGSATGVPGNTSPSVTQGFGGSGGSSMLSGGGLGGTNGGNAGNAPALGYGGGGGGAGTNSSYIAMAGGGGGGYTEKLINSPSATYSYAVGAGGAGGTGGGTGGGVGGAGAAGVIIITEYYV